MYPRLWNFEGLYVAQEFRLTSNVFRLQPRCERYLPEAPKHYEFGISLTH